VCPGVVTTTQVQAADGDHVAVGEVVVAGADRPDRPGPRPGQLREPGRRLGVVGVVVGEQGEPDPTAVTPDDLEHPREMVLVERPGVDDDALLRARLAQHPRVGAVEGHHARIRREHAMGPIGHLPRGPGGRHRREREGHPRGALVPAKSTRMTASPVSSTTSSGMIRRITGSCSKKSAADWARVRSSRQTSVGGRTIARPSA
jgi:hypothetical protein